MSNISKEQIVINKYSQKMFIEAENFIGKKFVKHGIYDCETIDLNRYQFTLYCKLACSDCDALLFSKNKLSRTKICWLD